MMPTPTTHITPITYRDVEKIKSACKSLYLTKLNWSTASNQSLINTFIYNLQSRRRLAKNQRDEIISYESFLKFYERRTRKKRIHPQTDCTAHIYTRTIDACMYINKKS